jgi:membrane protease YdiL (CAAX protease family)
MDYRTFDNRHPFIQLLMLALITLISLLAVMILSVVAGILFFRIPPGDWMTMLDVNNPANVPMLKFFQITQSLSMFIIPPVIFGWFMIRNPWRYLAVDHKPKSNLVLAVLLLAVLILPSLNLLSVWNEGLTLPHFLSGAEKWMKRTEEQADNLTTVFLSVSTFPGYLVNLLMIVVIPAIGEEFFFRGTLQQVLNRWFRNPHAAVILTAVLFSAFHMQFYGFFPRFVLGLIFGYLFVWSGNIWYAVIAHGINNFLPVTLTYFFPDQFDPAGLDQVGVGPNAWWYAILTLMLSAGVILFFHHTAKRQIQEDPARSSDGDAQIPGGLDI